MKIINLTQHAPSTEQLSAGVEPNDEKASEFVAGQLVFDTLPTSDEVNQRARALALFAYGEGAEAAMIGGAPWLMRPLAAELRFNGIKPLFAFSKRVSEETIVDGEGVKTSRFKHLGFVEG